MTSDISDTAQLVIVIRGKTESFQVVQELIRLKNLFGTTRGEDLFLSVCGNRMELDLP